MERLIQLYEEQGQSPWLDNLTRGYITSGQLAKLRDGGIRGLTSNPTIFQKAIEGSPQYDEQFRALARDDAAARGLVERREDLERARDVLQDERPVVVDDGGDGFVSVEVAPDLAHDTDGTTAAARHLNETIARPNLLVKIPGTAEGVPAIQKMISEGRSINVTLIFSLGRYGEVMEAYLSGLEACQGDLSGVHSVASFFVSRVDTEVDRRLEAIGSPEALALRGKAAVAQAKLAYQQFGSAFTGPRWEALAARGAHLQRPLWASTSTKNPAYPDTLYVDSLIGPDTVNTLPDATIEGFADHGTIARTIDSDLDDVHAVWTALADVGVDMDDVAAQLEREGVSSFQKSFDELLGALTTKANELRH